jgi:hypothetical protein
MMIGQLQSRNRGRGSAVRTPPRGGIQTDAFDSISPGNPRAAPWVTNHPGNAQNNGALARGARPGSSAVDRTAPSSSSPSSGISNTTNTAAAAASSSNNTALATSPRSTNTAAAASSAVVARTAPPSGSASSGISNTTNTAAAAASSSNNTALAIPPGSMISQLQSRSRSASSGKSRRSSASPPLVESEPESELDSGEIDSDDGAFAEFESQADNSRGIQTGGAQWADILAFPCCVDSAVLLHGAPAACCLL